ncbi:MAG: hypothetical protein IAG13_14760 [Deltaproteobacteria bacterium]|nr:hypothetical protein [Nannocystaceae bacterium]
MRRHDHLLLATLVIGCTAAEGGDGESGTSAASASNDDAPTSSVDVTSASTSPSSTSASETGGTDDDGSSGDASDDGPPPGTGLLERLSQIDVTVPEGVSAGPSSWRIWGTGPLGVAPVFTVPLAGCESLVGYTTSNGSAITSRASRIADDGAVIANLELGVGRELRGLAAEPDGSFGALVWDPTGQRIWVERHLADGTASWSTELTNADNHPTDFGIGDSRLDFGGGSYRAYYHVHSDSGHEGDTLKSVSAADGVESTQWGWGCSHSMSEVLRYNAAFDDFLSGCVTDCYPGTNGDFATQSIGGIYTENGASKILDVDAGCNGSVAGELGSAAPFASGWALSFNAHQAPATLGQSSYDVAAMDQDIGFATVAADRTPSAVTWLTTTPDIDEDDSSIARWQPEGEGEQFVIGWHEPSSSAYRLARIDATGAVLEGPVDVTGATAWGRRDDPFRSHGDGDIVWSWFDTPGSTTLHFVRIDAGGDCG